MDCQVQSPPHQGGSPCLALISLNNKLCKQGDQLLWEEPTDCERGRGQDSGVGDKDWGDHRTRVLI